jgi:hypothetical protein
LGGVEIKETALYKQFVCFFNGAGLFYCYGSNSGHDTADLSGMNRTYGHASHTGYAFTFVSSSGRD